VPHDQQKWPHADLPIRVELAFGAEPDGDQAQWQWVDVSADLPAQEIPISRGRADESSDAQPTSASLRLDNLHGQYTPDNPMSSYWPTVGLGTPCRISVQVPDVRYVTTAGSPAGGATTPHAAALDMQDELDVRVEAGLSWDVAQPQVLAAQWRGDERSWIVAAWENALLVVTSLDGTVGTAGWVGWRIGVRRHGAVRVTLHADSVANETRWRLYSAPDLDGPWGELFSFDEPGYFPPHAGTAPVQIGGGADAGLLADLQQAVSVLPPAAGDAPGGELYRAEIRLGDTLVASPDFRAMAVGDTELTDSSGLTWTLGADAAVTDWHVRMAGLVDAWQPIWPHGDLSDPERPDEAPGEAHVDITVAGILRRLGQGRPPVQSTLRRRIPTAEPPPLAYWPMEDGAEATEAASALPGGAPLRLTGVHWAADDTLGGSAALPTMGQVTELYGTIPGAATGGWHAEMVYRLDTMPTTERTVLRLSLAGASGGVVAVRGRVSTGGIRVEALDEDNAVVASGLFTNAAAVAAFTGGWNRVQIFSFQDGGNCRVRMAWRDVGSNTYWFAGTVWSGSTVGRVTAVRGVWGSDWQGAGLGHLAAWDVGGSGLTTPGIRIYDGADAGWRGQVAAQRIADVAALEGIPLTMRGDLVGTQRVGPERPQPALDLITEAAAVDGGVLGEQRVAPGLEYLTRGSFYNLPPRLQLTARGNEIAEPFAPVLDDQRIRNDVTVQREGGSSARSTDEASIAARGQYPTSTTINAFVDGQLEPIAAWELHLGTWPGMRYPTLTVDLATAPHLVPGWLLTDTGDRVTVDGLPPQHPPGTVDLLVEGYTETLAPTAWTVEANCSPAGPWTVAAVAPDEAAPGEDDPPGHVDTDGSELAVAAGEADADLYVTATVAPAWVESTGPRVEAEAGDLPVDVVVGGERVTVTDIGPAEWDLFDRTETGTWGTADSGTPWVEMGGAPSDRSVAAGAGSITLAADPGEFRIQTTTAVLEDCDIRVLISQDQLTTGGGSLPGIALRVASGTALYRVCAGTLNTGGLLLIALNGVTSVGLASATWGYSAGVPFWLRARVNGQRLRGRMWPTTVREPTWWDLDVTVTADTIAAGTVGLTSSSTGTNTNTNLTHAFREFQVISPQRFTAVRSVNRIVKQHPVGTDVRLADPAPVPL
jgi:hypothetical protein